MSDVLAALRARVQAAQHIVVLTGAGVSAESGIPTFRGGRNRAPTALAAPVPQGESLVSGRPVDEGGLWARFDPMQLASEEGFLADPHRVWAWYAERRRGVRAARPNAGHLALSAFAQAHPGRLTVITQNVDDLHQRAGNVDAIRLHGDILEDRWLEPCPRRGSLACDTEWAQPGEPPRCRDCGNAVRPGVVWFGENLPLGALLAAEAAADRAELMLVVGTSGAVWPAAGLAARARRAGAWVAIVNPAESEIDGDARELVRGTAASVLPQLFA